MVVSDPQMADRINFEQVWERIRAHEGDTFRQIRGGEFTYTIIGNTLVPDCTSQNIPRSHFQQAFQLAPLDNTVPFQHLRGPSYVFAVLMDRRIRQADW